jgi:hypothetical protein
MTPAEQMNDRLFMAFPSGWFVGIILGAVYAGFHWNNLPPELGRTLLVAVTSSQVTTLLLTMRIIRKFL